MREYEVNGELLDESCDLFEKKKRPGIKTTYTTGDIGYSMRQFNKRFTGYGNDNNNPSTEEAKARAAAEKAAAAVGTFASQSPDGGSSISTAPAGGATGGDSAGASAGGGLGEAVELDEYKIPKNIADMISFFEGTEEECKDFIATKLKPTAKDRWISPQLVKEMPSGKYSVAYYKDDLITEDVDLDEASNLTPEEKMRAWHNGARRENIKACSDEKLKNYLRICKQNNWSNEVRQIERELSARGIVLPSSNNAAQTYNNLTNTVAGISNTLNSTPATSPDYAKIFAKIPMRDASGNIVGTIPLIVSDSFYARNYGLLQPGELPWMILNNIKIDSGDDDDGYMMMSMLLGLLLLALTKQDGPKILQLKQYFNDTFGIDGKTLKTKLLDLLDDPIVANGLNNTAAKLGWRADMGENLNTTELREAKRYVRRYYIRPWDIFCSNKAEILKALVDNQNENCSVYTLNNLGDEKDVTKLTNKDIIYYYDDGILYDKNHVKVMDYDLYIKHEENRDSIKPSQVSDTTFAKVYDDRITTATELEEGLFDRNPVCSLDELRDKLLDGLYIVVGVDQKDADTEVSFSDNGYYSHTNYEASYEDGIGFTVQGWLVSDDGAEEEGERTDFDTFEELVEWINGKDFDECYIKSDKDTSLTEDVGADNLYALFTNAYEKIASTYAAEINKLHPIHRNTFDNYTIDSSFELDYDAGSPVRDMWGDKIYDKLIVSGFFEKDNELCAHVIQKDHGGRVRKEYPDNLDDIVSEAKALRSSPLGALTKKLLAEFNKSYKSLGRKMTRGADAAGNSQEKMQDDVQRVTIGLSEKDKAELVEWLQDNLKSVQFMLPTRTEGSAYQTKKYDTMLELFMNQFKNAVEGRDYVFNRDAAHTSDSFTYLWQPSALVSFKKGNIPPATLVTLIDSVQDIAQEKRDQLKTRFNVPDIVRYQPGDTRINNLLLGYVILSLFDYDFDKANGKQVVSHTENNPLDLHFPDIDAKGDVLHEGKEDTYTCCICGEEFKGYGNNPEPYMSAENGERCCDACNAHFVIQARLNQMAAERNNAKEDD